MYSNTLAQTGAIAGTGIMSHAAGAPLWAAVAVTCAAIGVTSVARLFTPAAKARP